MNTLWTSADICAATGGTCTGNWQVGGIQIDSRAIQDGDLFLALKGEHTDGHRFAGQALDHGASGVLVSQLLETVPEQRQIVVPDVEAALNQLAIKRRAEVDATIIAVTGSVGKTSVKEMLAHVLSRTKTHSGHVHFTHGNFNNHLGLPLTFTRMPKDTRLAVLELGMSGAGEIAHLSRLARPQIGIITSVDAVHIEFFDNGIDGIADAKSEIWHGLEHGGTAILPIDNPNYPRLLEQAQKGSTKYLLTFGTQPEADICLRASVPMESGQNVSITVKGEAHSYALGLRGEHQALNSCAVIAALTAANIPLADALPHFASLQPPKGRGRIHQLDIKGRAVRLIDDSYNASPASMRAAMQLLAERTAAHNVRGIAILGDMLELGDDAISYHTELATAVKQHGITHLFTCGPLMAHLHDALPASVEAIHVETLSDLAPQVETVLQQGDILLVKGSHGSQLWKLVERWVE